jgi:hypothetical protein
MELKKNFLFTYESLNSRGWSVNWCSSRRGEGSSSSNYSGRGICSCSKRIRMRRRRFYYRHVLFYSGVAFLENITQIEHKIPILNSAFCGD